MTTLARQHDLPTPSATGPLTLARRTLALAALETRIFLRNRTAVVNATLLPLALAGAFALIGMQGDAARVLPVAMAIASCLIFVVYYSIVGAVVARRQSGVLKRLLTGTVPRPGILAAGCAPFLALFVAEVALAVAAVSALRGAPAHPLIIVLAVLLAGVTWSLLALASTVFTRSVESAQVTTVPLMLGSLLFSGLSLPTAWMPEPVRVIAELSPLRPVTDLTWLATTGHANPEEVFVQGTVWAGIGVEVAVLLAWALAATLVLRRFRWEARV
ncbi:MAG: ABC transporter permease [Actinomycetales bacterium]